MYEILNMELQYESDLISLFDKLKLINQILGMDEYYYSKFGSITMELAYYLLMRRLDGNIIIELSSGTSDYSKIRVICNIPKNLDKSQTNETFSSLHRFIQNFNGNLELNNQDVITELKLNFGTFKTSMILDDIAIDQLKKELTDNEFKQYATKSKEDLLFDLKERSSKLKEMTNYIEMIERKSDEISQLNEELSNKNLELQSSMERVKQADRTKSQFLANMSHELRTPLNSIIGFSQLLTDGLLGDINDEQNESINDILDSARHLLNLINQILDISKIEAGMMEIKPRPIEIHSIINEVKTQLQPLLGSKGLELIIELEDNQRKVFADVTRLKQILINLLSNAIKFSNENSKIILKTELDNQFLQISIQDFGIGINEEDQKSIFAEFKQVDDSHTREYQGTGLGLSLCKRLVELHSGKIWVRSTVGEGSTFYFTLSLEEF